MNLPAPVTYVLRQLEAHGHAACLTGGCVRDWLMNAQPHDYDIASSAPAEEVVRIFQKDRVIETGLKHGTVTVLVQGLPIEVTAFRGETLEKDLACRDLTINAMAYHPEKGLIDPCGGQRDIRDRILRAPGTAEERFREDPLRILRVLRFASATGFAIDPDTLDAMQALAPKLSAVSAERLASEFIRLLCGSHVRQVISAHTDILSAFIPEARQMIGFEQHNWHHIYTVLDHTACTLENIPPEPVLRLAMFFHDIGKPACFAIHEDGQGHFYGHAKISADIAETVLRRLKADNFTRERVCVLVREHDRQIEPQRRSVQRAAAKLGADVFRQLLQVKRADTMGLNPVLFDRQTMFDQIGQLLDDILTSGACTSQRQLAIGGRDLMAMGMPQGPQLGQALNALLDAVTGGEVPNTREALCAFVRKKYNPGD